MTDEALTSLGKQVPDISDYSSDNNLIDFRKNIDEQLKVLIGITDEEYAYICETVKNIRK